LFPTLPADDLFVSLVLLTAVSARAAATRLLAWFLLGFATMWIAAWNIIDNRLDPEFHGETIDLVARVADFPRLTETTLRFVVEPLEQPQLPARVRLSWYEADAAPQLGEVWQLRVRLRRPHGYSNPGGFDYEGWLFRQRIGATGYVISDEANQWLSAESAGRLARFRQNFVERITALLPSDDAAAVLLAVSVGARHRITREQWDRYAITGTIHLMAISGLHIGLAAGGVFFIAWGLFAPLCRHSNVRDLALTTAVVAAASYAAVSGFAIPAQRAFLMAMLAAAAVLFRHRLDIGALVAFPCIVLFFLNPVSIHAPGFKLSFAAVAIILWLMQSHFVTLFRGGLLANKVGGNLQRLGLLQIALLTGLFPLTTLIFGRFSMIAPLMNLLILPLFNFITVPFCLAGMLLNGPLQGLGDLLLVAAYQSIRLVLSLVSFAADLPGVRSTVVPPQGLAAIIILLPALHLLLPCGWPGRKLAWVALLAVLLYRPPGPPPGCLDYHVLDVGQGLAVVLRSGDHSVLFDTGPAFRSGSNTAELVIIPFLESRGIHELDTLIVSHADQDHAGGAQSIAEEYVIGETFVGEPLSVFGHDQIACNTAVTWSVEDVRFRFLHPPLGRAWEGNNASCVLEVAIGSHKLLLTGDIETPVEAALLEHGEIGRVDTVVIPHHGSRTSSSADFVARLEPDLAIVSAGFGNRWGFPKPDVVRRWENTGAVLLETATSGAIGQRLCVESEVSKPSEERPDARKYWHE
jgi:competence protein ComEC